MRLIAAGCIMAAAWLYDRYHFAVRWPAEVQRETVGKAVAGADKLLSKERHFAFGEGFARWKYKADSSSEALQSLCGNVEVRRCSFTRSRVLDEGVTLNVSLSRGVLTVEEWWS